MELDYIMQEAINSIVSFYFYNSYEHFHIGNILMYVAVPGVAYKCNKEAISKYKQYTCNFETKSSKYLYYVKKHHVKIIVLLTMSFLLYLKSIWLIEVTSPVDTISGVKQRIDVYDKLEHYLFRMKKRYV